MATTIRISDQAKEKIAEIADEQGSTMTDELEKAVEQYWAQRFLEELNEDFAELRNDEDAWASELAERRQWTRATNKGEDEDPW